MRPSISVLSIPAMILKMSHLSSGVRTVAVGMGTPHGPRADRSRARNMVSRQVIRMILFGGIPGLVAAIGLGRLAARGSTKSKLPIRPS